MYLNLQSFLSVKPPYILILRNYNPVILNQGEAAMSVDLNYV